MLRALADTVLSALRTLGANKLRSTLTLLGIVIGVVAVVSMAATTVGLRRQINDDLQALGTGVFQVQKEPMGFANARERAKAEKRKNFTLSDVEMLRDQCSSCLRVGGELWDRSNAVSHGRNTSPTAFSIVGGTSEFFDNNGYALASGRLFSDGEAAHGSDVIVLGAQVVDVLFPQEDPIGQVVQVKGRAFHVIGVLERRGSNMGGTWDDLVAIPITSFLVAWGQNRSLHVTVQARDGAHPGATQDEVITILRRWRHVPPTDENDFEMFSNQSLQETFDKLTGSIAVASIGICAIALLIGGIGVMNIMLVSVTERTSEIGVRRALGARRRRILGQFVLEAIVLCSVGGAIGVALGAGVAFLVKVMVGVPAMVPAWAVMLSMLTAGGTGLVFGIYPAWRASRLDPVEAMRHE